MRRCMACLLVAGVEAAAAATRHGDSGTGGSHRPTARASGLPDAARRTTSSTRRSTACRSTPNSAAYIATIGGTRKLHLDLGSADRSAGRRLLRHPVQLVHGSTMTWPTVAYTSTDPGPRLGSEPGERLRATPATPSSRRARSRAPQLADPGERRSSRAASQRRRPAAVRRSPHPRRSTPTCRLWETYHAYKPSGAWNIFGSARLRTCARTRCARPTGRSADAAGFPILPLLLAPTRRAAGAIKHALRFTIAVEQDPRLAYVWPARHLTSNGTNRRALPPMGQLFRLKASYMIPANFSTQSKAILQAMKTYGMYIADGGSDWYVSGEPSASWDDSTFSRGPVGRRRRTSRRSTSRRSRRARLRPELRRGAVKRALVWALLVGCTDPRFVPLSRTLPAWHDPAQVTTYTLANGMRIALLRDPAARVASIDLRLEVGTGDDPAGHAGLAADLGYLLTATPQHALTTQLAVDADRTEYRVDHAHARRCDRRRGAPPRAELRRAGRTGNRGRARGGARAGAPGHARHGDLGCGQPVRARGRRPQGCDAVVRGRVRVLSAALRGSGGDAGDHRAARWWAAVADPQPVRAHPGATGGVARDRGCRRAGAQSACTSPGSGGSRSR